MSRRAVIVRPVVVLSLSLASLLGQTLVSADGRQDPQQPPRRQFRTSTTLIPVDVRVLDRQGRPITDLTQADFTIEEDRRAQSISFFSSHSLVAEPPNPNALPLLRDPRNAEVAAQNHRVFLLVLGRGRLQPPAKGVDAMLEFVKDRLLPQDHVGILAWNRATDLTTDHAKIVAVLERFKKDHEKVEALMKQRFGGLTAVYGGSRIPDSIQTRIDAIFKGPESADVRELAAATVADRERRVSDQRRAQDLLMGTSTLDVIGAEQASSIDLSFEDYVEGAAQTNQDIANLYTGIEYLRHLAGEKHMVLVTENGLQLPRMEDSTGLASVANDARVVIDTIHTGGLPVSGRTAPPNASVQTSARGAAFVPDLPGPSLATRQRVADLRLISVLTGGIASQYQYASRGVQRIAAATGFQYLLGYYPTNTNWNGRYRNIRVRVNRPGVTVLYRRGYFGSQELPPLNRIEMLTYSRIAGAANYDRDVPDIGFTLDVAREGDPVTAITASLVISADRLSLVEQSGLRRGQLKIAVFVGDKNERVISESWQTMDLNLSDERYRQLIAEGIPHQVRMPVTGVPAYVKAIVYDFNADRVGSIAVKVR
jgi:VWFA-related protein